MEIIKNYINKSFKKTKNKKIINKSKPQIFSFVHNILYHYHKKNDFNIFLTGGKSIQEFYKHLKGENFKFKSDKIFLTDERITKSYGNTNEKNIIKFFPKNSYKNFFYKKKIFDRNKIKALNQLDIKNHIILCSLGNDGHIASIFKKDASSKNYIHSKSKLHKLDRITITNKIFKRSQLTILFALGMQKTKKLKYLLNKKQLSNEPVNVLKNFIIFSDHY